MSLYVEVRKTEDGNIITNATFPYNYYANYGNGVYYVVCDLGATIYCTAPGRTGLWAGTDSYWKLFIWLAPAPPPHSQSHSSGWT